MFDGMMSRTTVSLGYSHRSHAAAAAAAAHSHCLKMLISLRLVKGLVEVVAAVAVASVPSRVGAVFGLPPSRA